MVYAEHMMLCNILANMLEENKDVKEFQCNVPLTSNEAEEYTTDFFCKKEKGIPLLGFINNLRIEHAVKLIKEGRHTKKEISKMAGFTSERSFYRILKQHEDSIKKQ